jgi:hypothetical protein
LIVAEMEDNSMNTDKSIARIGTTAVAAAVAARKRWLEARIRRTSRENTQSFWSRSASVAGVDAFPGAGRRSQETTYHDSESCRQASSEVPTMKTFLGTFALLFLFAGLSTAQSVTLSVSGTVVTAIDGDDTCIFTAPTVTDSATIECYVGKVDTADLKLHSSVFLKLGTPVGSSFTANLHTISWTLERIKLGSSGQFTFDIALDGIHHVGTF